MTSEMRRHWNIYYTFHINPNEVNFVSLNFITMVLNVRNNYDRYLRAGIVVKE